jgi:hypothetical protein
MPAGDVPLTNRTGQAMQAEAPGGFVAAIEAGDHLAMQIHHLAVAIDPQPGAAVVRPQGAQ